MRSLGIVFLLGLVLAFIAFQARTGILRHDGPNDQPANKYMRQMMENPQLSTEDSALLMVRYGTAHVNTSGLRYIRRAPGTGEPPKTGDLLMVQYEGFLLDGTKFDSSIDRGEPYSFRLGTGSVIKGWDEAFAGMLKGEKRTLIIPYWLGYGESGRGRIPPKATLVFEVELLDIR